MVSRGDVCWLELADAGRRPVCVLTRDNAIPRLANVVVALITRTVRGIPSEVPLDEADGMPGECAITLDNLRTVPKALLTERITRLSGVRINEACRALALATACG
jgi:mRNA interferase MazF